MTEDQFLEKTKSVRKKILSAIYRAQKGHVGGAFSIADFLTYVYVKGLVLPHPGGLQSSVKTPLVLSKAHSATALLAVMSEVFPEKCAPLDQYNSRGSLIGNNPSEMVFGVEFHAGSLGHGISFSSGLALAAKLSGEHRRILVVVSDGEMHEGTSWEGLLFAAHHKLNICIVVDRNNQICESFIDDAISLGDFKEKMAAFGFFVKEIDGHKFADLETIDEFVDSLAAPRVLILNTIKGKGVGFMESEIRFHHSIPSAEEYRSAMKELEK